jgi:hypothetical protein
MNLSINHNCFESKALPPIDIIARYDVYATTSTPESEESRVHCQGAKGALKVHALRPKATARKTTLWHSRIAVSFTERFCVIRWLLSVFGASPNEILRILHLNLVIETILALYFMEQNCTNL